MKACVDNESPTSLNINCYKTAILKNPPPLLFVIYYWKYFFRKSLHPRPRRGLASGSSGNVDIVLFGNYDPEANIDLIGTKLSAISKYPKEDNVVSGSQSVRNHTFYQNSSYNRGPRGIKYLSK